MTPHVIRWYEWRFATCQQSHAAPPECNRERILHLLEKLRGTRSDELIHVSCLLLEPADCGQSSHALTNTEKFRVPVFLNRFNARLFISGINKINLYCKFAIIVQQEKYLYMIIFAKIIIIQSWHCHKAKLPLRIAVMSNWLAPLIAFFWSELAQLFWQCQNTFHLL